MKKLYALNLADDGRILSTTFDRYGAESQPRVDTLPDGNLADYKFIDGEYIYDPLPNVDAEIVPTDFERVEAQVTYTAMMTDTLLEV